MGRVGDGRGGQTQRPQVALNLDGNSKGGDIVVLTGTAALAARRPRASDDAAYVAKYGPDMTRVSGSPEAFSEAYPVAIEVTVTRVRGF